jgi:hypothetical protein
MTTFNVADAVDDPSVRFQCFDDSSLESFRSVWRTRLIEATDIHRRADLRSQAERILGFVADVPASDLRLYLLPAQKTAFLYRVSTKASLLTSS